MASKNAELLSKTRKWNQGFAFIQSGKFLPFSYRAMKFVYAKDII